MHKEQGSSVEAAQGEQQVSHGLGSPSPGIKQGCGSKHTLHLAQDDAYLSQPALQDPSTACSSTSPARIFAMRTAHWLASSSESGIVDAPVAGAERSPADPPPD